ncbi:hypothetical protein GGX14DRAFT_608249 [Mycena pura]|uniref:Uncharacterized protein n=1 Tax=Mycena pura TaxID=153505 RepID=A0AAD6YEJ1_9AGAR|nr:hypothetical protein GGX14DRAFT_608249 [Mycena pura]
MDRTVSSVSKYIQLSSDPNKAYSQTLLSVIMFCSAPFCTLLFCWFISKEASGTQSSLSARANCFPTMVKKYADAEQTQAPADSANTAVKAAQGPSLFAMVVALQDSPAGLQVTKEMAEGRVGGGHKLGINYMEFIKGIEYIQIYSKYIRIHFPQYDMIHYRYDTAPAR